MGVSRRGVLGTAGAAGLAGMLGAAPALAAGEDEDREESAAVIGRAKADQLHVMQFNIRFDANAAPGTADSWIDRRPVLAQLLELEQPTVLGTQEVLYRQLKQISEDLPPFFDSIGVGREGGSRGEFVPIFFDTRRVEPLAFDHFWLSDTPNLIASNTWGGGSIRMVTWVRFRDLRTGKEFIHLNSHFDNAAENARRLSAGLVRDRIAGFDPSLPVIVTCDFNTGAPNSETYRILVTNGGLVDTWLAGEQVTPLVGTFPNYREPVPNGNRIDWILTNTRVQVLKAAINPFRVDGRFPSDHLPVQALVRLA